ncbi:MAG: hypothetical protein V1772_14065, partial [Chloroflexota bacterium]
PLPRCAMANLGGASAMLNNLLNFQGVNWWTLLGGMGLNFVITIVFSIAGAYFGSNEATLNVYAQVGPPLLVLGVFLGCLLAGFITGKLADENPIKHAFLASLGAFVPYVAVGVMSLNPMILMLAAVAVAGNLNGGILAQPRRRR